MHSLSLHHAFFLSALLLLTACSGQDAKKPATKPMTQDAGQVAQDAGQTTQMDASTKPVAQDAGGVTKADASTKPVTQDAGQTTQMDASTTLEDQGGAMQPDQSSPAVDMKSEDAQMAAVQGADVTAVTVRGAEGAYTFSVTIESPDTGCDQYANWWEVVTPSGELLYRRILGHSHINEQPFERSGGPVNIKSTQRVYVRAHMNNTGYGGQVMAITPAGGDASVEQVSNDFAKDLEKADPQPGPCPA